MSTKLTAVILAGGMATRLGGQDKGLALLDGRPLIEHILDRLRPQVRQILINCNRNQDSYSRYGYPTLPDRFGGHPGPLAGLHAAMHYSTAPMLLTVPCDCPWLPTDLAEKLMEAIQTGTVAVARTVRSQPVFALYRREVLPSLEIALRTELRAIGRWQQTLDCRFADFSAQEEAFRNLNCADDWPQS